MLIVGTSRHEPDLVGPDGRACKWLSLNKIGVRSGLVRSRLAHSERQVRSPGWAHNPRTPDIDQKDHAVPGWDLTSYCSMRSAPGYGVRAAVSCSQSAARARVRLGAVSGSRRMRSAPPAGQMSPDVVRASRITE